MSNASEPSIKNVSESLLACADVLLSLDSRIRLRGLNRMPSGFVQTVRVVSALLARLDARQPPPPEILTLDVTRWISEDIARLTREVQTSGGTSIGA